MLNSRHSLWTRMIFSRKSLNGQRFSCCNSHSPSDSISSRSAFPPAILFREQFCSEKITNLSASAQATPTMGIILITLQIGVLGFCVLVVLSTLEGDVKYAKNTARRISKSFSKDEEAAISLSTKTRETTPKQTQPQRRSFDEVVTTGRRI